jgi:hypothetical protein
LVCAHSPFEVAVKVPLIAGPSSSAWAARAMPKSAISATETVAALLGMAYLRIRGSSLRASNQRATVAGIRKRSLHFEREIIA